MKPANVPDTATEVPYQTFPTTGMNLQEVFISSIKAQVANMNATALGIWNTTKERWLAAATQDRNNNIPIRPKPAQPQTLMLHEVSGDKDTNGHGTIWIWDDLGGPLGTPCPDLPSEATVVVGGMKVGNAVPGGGGLWFNALPGDTMPDGHIDHAMSADGVEGLFKRKLGWGSGGTQGGGGYYQKIG